MSVTMSQPSVDTHADMPTEARKIGRIFDVVGEHPDAERRITDLLDIVEIVRPVIAADGGELSVVSVDVAGGVVTLRLAGACGSCAISSTTLNQGIDRILRDRLDWVTSVVGVVEESEVSGYGGWTPKSS